MNDDGNQSSYDGGGDLEECVIEENIDDNLLSSLTNFTNIEIVNAQETESVDKMVTETESRIDTDSNVDRILELRAKRGTQTADFSKTNRVVLDIVPTGPPNYYMLFILWLSSVTEMINSSMQFESRNKSQSLTFILTEVSKGFF